MHAEFKIDTFMVITWLEEGDECGKGDPQFSPNSNINGDGEPSLIWGQLALSLF